MNIHPPSCGDFPDRVLCKIRVDGARSDIATRLTGLPRLPGNCWVALKFGYNDRTMPNDACSDCDRLQSNVVRALERIEALTKKQLEAVDQKEILMDVDKQLELAMGEKERAIGAFLEHQRTH